MSAIPGMEFCNRHQVWYVDQCPACELEATIINIRYISRQQWQVDRHQFITDTDLAYSKLAQIGRCCDEALNEEIEPCD